MHWFRVQLRPGSQTMFSGLYVSFWLERYYPLLEAISFLLGKTATLNRPTPVKQLSHGSLRFVPKERWRCRTRKREQNISGPCP